jgi:hypothetical protein
MKGSQFFPKCMFITWEKPDLINLNARQHITTDEYMTHMRGIKAPAKDCNVHEDFSE